MAEFNSPVKPAPSSPKRRRDKLILKICVICRQNTTEALSKLTSKGRDSFVAALKIRKDEVFHSLLQVVSSLDEIDTLQINYHRSCYKSYTSKQNCSTFKSVSFNDIADDSYCDQLKSDNPSTSNALCVTTRSKLRTVDWINCIFCNKKTFKKDRNLHSIESDERVKNICCVAETSDDQTMIKLLSHPDFRSKALYHSGCITKYLLKKPKQKPGIVKPESVDIHEVAFDKLVALINRDLIVHKKAFLMSYLLEKYRFFLPQEAAANYSTAKLQTKLLKHYGSSAVV